ncbi:hypothetical protein AX16_004876 [Volvariella volvacea WC 439]|nr:hypothetical protein AX16_004876 [Volvariella volvacea WC 439]
MPALPELVDDVVTEILYHLSTDTDNVQIDWGSNRKTLINVALAGSRHSERALRVLWQSLDSLYPLLRLLPQLKRYADQYVLVGARLEPHKRFKAYAAMVREFKCKPIIGPAAQINKTVYTSIARDLGCLLPNLRSLYIDLRTTPLLCDLEYVLPTICGPSLRRVAIWDDTHILDVLPFLSTLRYFSEDIQALTVSGRACYASLNSIHSFPKLEKLVLSPNSRRTSHDTTRWSSQPFLKGLAGANSLEDLSLDLTKHNDLSLEIDTGLGLFSLRRLSLRGRLALLASLVDHAQAVGLVDLDLDFICEACSIRYWSTGYHTHWDNVVSLVKAISNNWSRTLSSFKLRLACNRIWGTCTLEPLLGPLATLTQLQSLQLMDDYDCLPMISTKEWYVLEKKFGRLEVLYLSNAMASLPRLHSLASHLPRLRTLGVQISLQNVPPIRNFAL